MSPCLASLILFLIIPLHYSRPLLKDSKSLMFSNNVEVFPSCDDEPHKHSIFRDVGTPLDKYTRSSLFDLLLMVYVDSSYYSCFNFKLLITLAGLPATIVSDSTS